MIQLELNEQERMILIHMVENCITDLRDEIYRTETLDYKEMLRERKYVLIHLLEALKKEAHLPTAS